MVWWLIGVPLFVVTVVICIVTFYSLRQAHWDNEVTELCARDGGVKVYEIQDISMAAYAKLPRVGGNVVIPPKRIAPTDSPLFTTATQAVIRESNPAVKRIESVVRRRSDNRIVGSIVTYMRTGGDIPTGLRHPTSYTCPRLVEQQADQAKFFRVERKEK